MQMQLTIHERLIARKLLPKQGRMVTLNVIEDAERLLGFTEDEIKEFDLKDITLADGTSLAQWDPKVDAVTRPIGLSDAAIALLKVEVIKLEEAGKLLRQQKSLYEKLQALPPPSE